MAREKKEKDRVVGQVYETNNLDKFKLIKGNREVTENRKLRNDIVAKGILEPIKVNKNMEVTDGQHRLAIARELNISVPYIFSDKSTNSIIGLNNTHKPWKLTDYLHSYTEAGSKDYIRLTNILQRFPALRVSTTAQQATGFGQGYTRKTDNVKNGSFKFRNYAEFVKFAKDYQKFIDVTGVRTNSAIQTAYFMLFVLTPFDSNRFIKKAISRNLSEGLSGVTSISRVVRTFVETNNSGLSLKSKNWISLVTDELGMGHFNNEINSKLVETSPVFNTK